MATENIQVIRLEISQTGGGSNGRSNPEVISPGTLVASADVGRKINNKLQELMNPTRSPNWSDHYDENTAKKVADFRGSQSRPPMEPDFDPDYTPGSVPKPTQKEDKKKSSIKDKSTPITRMKFDSKKAMKYGKKGVTAGLTAYAMYSQHKTIGYNLSGATHAAQMQQRVTTATSFGAGLALSIATGQYLATAVMLAGRAWQLGQTNRQELYQIRSSQIVSNIMKERLVTNTIQRRF